MASPTKKKRKIWQLNLSRRDIPLTRDTKNMSCTLCIQSTGRFFIHPAFSASESLLTGKVK